MTTPAILINGQQPAPFELLKLVNGAWVVQGTADAVFRRYYRVRGESISSPRRVDRTRAPKPWYSEAFSSFGPQGTLISNNGQWMIRGFFPSVQMSDRDSIPFPEHLVRRAKLQAMLSLKDSKVNLGVALAEARKTAELVGDVSTRVAKQLDSNANRYLGPQQGAKKKLSGWKKVPSWYLELCYGWTPLLSDVLGSCEAVADAQARGHRWKFTTKASAVDTARPTKDLWVPLQGVKMQGRWNHHQMAKVSMVFILPDNILSSLSSVGITNPAEVLWEEVPYSFVVDWFLPIGSWLSALDAGTFMQYSEGSLTTFDRWDGLKISFPGGGFAGSDASMSSYRMQRTVLQTNPSVLDMLPSLRNPLSLTHMAQGLSLLTQVFRKWT